jgi:Flp pilus assembly protein CpaB
MTDRTGTSAPTSPARAGPRDPFARLRELARWRRTVLLRRAAAGLLLLLAAVLALRPPGSATAAVVVAARDLAPGAVVAPADLTVRSWPADLAPSGVLADPEPALGKVLAGALRAGEPVTDLRLAVPVLAAAATGLPDAAAVPVRLADPDVASLLTPGTRVDVVTAAVEGGAPRVVAESAVVLTVLEPGASGPGSSARGRSALVALPRDLATRVAAASLSDQVAVTLRSQH